MISLRYALTKEDFVNFTLYVQLEAPGKKKQLYKKLRPFIIIFFIICIVNFATAIASDKLGLSDFIVIPVILSLVLFPLLSTKSRLKGHALKIAGNSENAALFNITDYIFSETGIFVKDDVKEIRFHWKAFIKMQETPDYIYLFLNSSSALIIPLKNLRSSVERELLQKMLSQYISFDAALGHLVKS